MVGVDIIRIPSGNYSHPFVGTVPFMRDGNNLVDLQSADTHAFTSYYFEGYDFYVGYSGTYVYDMSAIPEPTLIGTVATYNFGAYNHITGYSHFIYTNSDYAGTWD
ncbi:MAG: hypothetical protein IPH09_03660 [bacterium]|nr:hypothetical protein [bacterium]